MLARTFLSRNANKHRLHCFAYCKVLEIFPSASRHVFIYFIYLIILPKFTGLIKGAISGKTHTELGKDTITHVVASARQPPQLIHLRCRHAVVELMASLTLNRLRDIVYGDFLRTFAL